MRINWHKKFDVGTEFARLPFMGIYRFPDKTTASPKTLIYPVPHPMNPFLGAHITLTLNGDIQIGPTAIPLFGREQYSINAHIEFSEFRGSIKSKWSLVKGKEYDLSEIRKGEVPKVITRLLVRDECKSVPEIGQNREWRNSAKDSCTACKSTYRKTRTRF